jgi:hypothetical protein
MFMRFLGFWLIAVIHLQARSRSFAVTKSVLSVRFDVHLTYSYREHDGRESRAIQ